MRIGQGFDVHAFGEGRSRRARRRADRPPPRGGGALRRRRDHSCAVRCAAGCARRGRHRPTFPRHRSALPRRRQPRLPARRGRTHERRGLSTDQRRHHRARRGTAHRRSSCRDGGRTWPPISARRPMRSTSRPPPRSAWGSSGEARASRPRPPCCSRARRYTRSSTYTAPVPPSMVRAEVNANTSRWRRSQPLTAVLSTGPRAPDR